MFISDNPLTGYYRLNDLPKEQVEIILKEGLRESGKEYFWRKQNEQNGVDKSTITS